MSSLFLPEIQNGNISVLARCISLIENERPGYYELLKQLPHSDTPVIGITGPPGVGKSSLVNALTRVLVSQNKKVAILCIDPSSPFHHGAFLGDRIRMNQWTGNPSVYIRSLSTRGSLGGLNPKIFEISDLLKSSPFDYIVIETVGIGQSEVEIAGIADCTALVLMPGSGDDIQGLKAGIMEIADLIVVNKADHPGLNPFLTNIKSAIQYGINKPEILETIATEETGIQSLITSIMDLLKRLTPGKSQKLTEKAFRIILDEKIKEIDKNRLHQEIESAMQLNHFNVYAFVEKWLSSK